MKNSSPISMRKSALRVYGGPLKNLYDVNRFEQGSNSSSRCWKDYRKNQCKAVA